MYTSKIENLLEVIEKLRKELNLLGSNKQLTASQVVEKSKELDRLLNIYYNI
jgi:hypothetical protein